MPHNRGMNKNTNTENLPIYSRITEYAGITSGEYIYCACGEHNAICPDCGSEVCVFCDGECPGCETPMW